MFKSLVREDESATNSNNLQSKKDGGQRQFIEEKNKFAMSVLRRVRVKLEGREPDSLRKVRTYMGHGTLGHLFVLDAGNFVIGEIGDVMLYRQSLW